MSHPTQSLLCNDCSSLFRTSRALKIHQQRFHSSTPLSFPNYNSLSSYLVVAFSSTEFPLICENACRQGHFPLGQFSSTFFRCSTCQISFPCSRTLIYHSFIQHEENRTEICRNLLEELIDEIESVSPMIDEEIQWNFLIQAQHLQLKRKRSAIELRRWKEKFHQQIFPKCSHPGRTCANLCLDHLIPSDHFTRKFSSSIAQQPKGNPFSQGSIVAKLPPRSLTNSEETNGNKEITTKRRPIKRAQSSLSDILSSTGSQSKKKLPIESNGKTTNSSLTRSTSSMIFPSKRVRSPEIALVLEPSVQKRRRQRKKTDIPSPIIIQLDDEVEQENEEEDEEISSQKSSKPKQRQASTGSIEYVQVLHSDSPVGSLKSMANVKTKAMNEEKEKIIHCSPPKRKFATSTPPSHQTLELEENIRVRCKVCGDIIEGRTRFSKHVMTMHSHLLSKTIAEATQQTTTVR